MPRTHMSARQQFARVVTEVLAPAPVAAVLLIAVSLRSSATPSAGLRWAALTVLVICAVLMGFFLQQVRRRRLTDRPVRLCEQRWLPLSVALGAILCGTALLSGLGVSRELVVTSNVRPVRARNSWIWSTTPQLTE